jgi:coenzyme F420-reducing hydrogenase delta subunit
MTEEEEMKATTDEEKKVTPEVSEEKVTTEEVEAEPEGAGETPEEVIETESPQEEEKYPGFQPKIIGFLCNWCSYAGADLAGISRLQMPPTVRIIRLMCSGGLDPGTVFEPLIKGADGVLVMGCHPGDCHYLTGNYQTIQRVNVIEKLMDKIDIDPQRIRLEWVSASEGGRFAEVVEEYTGIIKGLGPNPIKEGDEGAEKLKNQLIGARDAISSFRLRSVTGRIDQFIKEGNVYGEKYTEEELEETLNEIVLHEFIRSQILKALSETPKSVEELSEEIGEETNVIFHHVATLWKKQVILPVHSEGVSPKYVKAEGV